MLLQNFIMGVGSAGVFCRLVSIVATDGLSAFRVTESGGRYRGSGAGSAMLLVLLVTGLLACICIPQAFLHGRNYWLLRGEKRKQDAKGDDRGT
jgi:hypothetical protein